MSLSTAAMILRISTQLKWGQKRAQMEMGIEIEQSNVHGFYKSRLELHGP
jgi:hypothetical protein